jgi:hypothetical protein
MNWKVLERNRPWQSRGTISELTGRIKATKDFISNNWCLHRYLNRVLSEYESRPSQVYCNPLGSNVKKDVAGSSEKLREN